MPNFRRAALHFLLDTIEILVIGTCLAAFSWLVIAEAVEVTGDSMLPTLQNRERLIVEKVSIKLDKVGRGDIIVFKSPQDDKLLIKRVIALPNEYLEIISQDVYVDGKMLPEPYVSNHENMSSMKVQLKDGEYFVMGDNRGVSNDSRRFGPIKQSSIFGHAVLIISPVQEFRIIN